MENSQIVHNKNKGQCLCFFIAKYPSVNSINLMELELHLHFSVTCPRETSTEEYGYFVRKNIN